MKAETTVKDTNPKDAIGVRKAALSTIPMPALFEVGNVMLSGALKYARHNYRVAGVRSSVYFDACMRHLAQWWEGEDLDSESGMPHLAHAVACLLVVRDSEIQGNVNDDRPPRSPEAWMHARNKEANQISDFYTDPKPPHTEKDRDAGS